MSILKQFSSRADQPWLADAQNMEWSKKKKISSDTQENNSDNCQGRNCDLSTQKS